MTGVQWFHSTTASVVPFDVRTVVCFLSDTTLNGTFPYESVTCEFRIVFLVPLKLKETECRISGLPRGP